MKNRTIKDLEGKTAGENTFTSENLEIIHLTLRLDSRPEFISKHPLKASKDPIFPEVTF